MKIHNIRIRGLQQYNDTFIDFTNHATGEAANKICIIGRNGTGKSTLLNLLAIILNDIGNAYSQIPGYDFNIAVKFDLKSKKYYVFIGHSGSYFFHENIEDEQQDWFSSLATGNPQKLNSPVNGLLNKYMIDNYGELINEIGLKANSTDLLIHSPAESFQNSHLQISDVPSTNLDEALGFFEYFPYYHNVANETVAEFWKIMIYLIKKRENERNQFENSPENLSKTKTQLIEEFEKINPKILDRIAELWNSILNTAGLEFDVEKASNPIQLKENLNAYIVLKKTKQRIDYNNLSTGIRNFIFRIGHIYSLYFNRVIKRGFVLIDEPENSLFPDFLFDLVEIYEKIVVDKNGENNTQLFMSTHNPIIAAQFEPHERVILEWNDDGYVEAHKGVAPIGDDPNDVLIKDFKLTHVMGKKGELFWNQYLELKKQLRRATNDNEKEKLVREISEIGTKYNFK